MGVSRHGNAPKNLGIDIMSFTGAKMPPFKKNILTKCFVEVIIMSKKYSGRVDLNVDGFVDRNNQYGGISFYFVLEENKVKQIFFRCPCYNNNAVTPVNAFRVGVPLSQIGDLNGFAKSMIAQMGLRTDNAIKEHSVIGVGNYINFSFRIKGKRCFEEVAVAAGNVNNRNSVKYTQLKNAGSLVEMLKASSRLLERNTGCAFYE